VSAFLEGYLIGLSLVILIGPVLFVLLNSTLQGGRASGTAVALGIFMSDVFIVALCYLGSAGLEMSEERIQALCWLGAAVLIGLGYRYLSAPPPEPRGDQALSAGGLLSSFAQGVAVNLINPFVFFVWLGLITLARQRFPLEAEQLTSLSATLLGILTLDLSKVFLAGSLRAWLSPQRLALAQRLSGWLLLLFSARLLWRAALG